MTSSEAFIELKIVLENLNLMREKILKKIEPQEKESTEYKLGKINYLSIPYMRNVLDFLNLEKDTHTKIADLLKKVSLEGKEKKILKPEEKKTKKIKDDYVKVE